MSPVELTLLIGTPVIVACIARYGAYRKQGHTFAPGTPDSTVPMEARHAVRKARRDANWR